MMSSHPDSVAESKFRTSAVYVVAAILSLLIMYKVLHLKEARIDVPINAPNDGIYYSLQIKTLLETGWVTHNPSLGAPFGLYLYDFAHFDNLHLWIMKLIGMFTTRWQVVMNVFYILTFPLTTLTALTLFRQLKFNVWISLALALLYAFQPYHLWVGQGHIMLGAYFLVPLYVLVMFWVAERECLANEKNRLLLSSRFWLSLTLCILAASSGHYYALFACFFYVLAALRSALLWRQWKNLIHAGLLCTITLVGMLLNLMPNILYWAENGSNRVASMKKPQFSERYGLKLSQLFMPVRGHRVPSLNDLEARYRETSLTINGNQSAAVGIVAGTGLLLLLAFVVVPCPARYATEPIPLLSSVTLGAILLATVGGIGNFLAYTISPQIHGYNRISIFLAIFGHIAVGWSLTQCLSLPRFASRQALLAPVMALVLLFSGLSDQTSSAHRPAHKQTQLQSELHDRFGQTIEATLPPKSSIFLWPPSGFPFCDGHLGYSHFHLYLHTHDMRWSEPAMINRQGAFWKERLTFMNAEQLLAELFRAGFDAMIIDTRLQRPEDLKMLEEVARITQVTPVSDGGSRHLIDLRDFAVKRAAQGYPRARSASELCPVSVAYGAQFTITEQARIESTPRSWHSCHYPNAELSIVNHTGQPLLSEISLTLVPGNSPNVQRIRLRGLLTAEMPLKREGVEVRQRMVLAPGRNSLRFTCLPETNYSRGLCWFRVEDVKISPAANVDPPEGPSSK